MTKGELFDRLHRVEDLDIAIRCNQMAIEKLESSLQGHAIRYDQEKVQTSSTDRVADVMGDLEKLLKKQDRLRKQLADALNDVTGMIGLLTDRKQQLVLSYKYLACLPWVKIAEKMPCGERQVYRIHDNAIKILHKTL